MSQLQGEQTENAFDGQIQLNGDAAPELEVVVALTDRYVILSHASGELGRWDKAAVTVAPVGRGWFNLDVEDETVSFRPRRPGIFAASTLGLMPVDEPTTKRGRRKAAKAAKKDKPAKTETREPKQPKLSRKEKRRLRREEAAARAAVEEAQPPVARRGGLDPLPALPSADQLTPTPPPVDTPPVPEAAPVEPSAAPETPQVEPAKPDKPASTWLDPSEAPVPELFTRRPAPPVEPELPASPWDDVPTPEVPGRERRRKRSRDTDEPPVEATREKPAKPRRKAEKSLPTKTTKPRRDKKPAGKAPVAAKPAGPPEKSMTSRAFTAFKYGAKGAMYRISDELRQTGIVPFDRLPAAPARRTRPDEDHKHDFQEHRLPGGLTRNVCHGCGLVSIGEADDLSR